MDSESSSSIYSSDEQEGYDYDFVDPSASDDFTCPICQLVVRDAYQVNCCGKILCKECLDKLKKRLEICPMCRAHIGHRSFKDTRSNQEIKQLKVYCDYKNYGCKWIGELKYIENHMKDCDYQDIFCKDCDASMLKYRLKEHLEDDCPMRKYKCTLCSKEGTYRSITNVHPSTCPQVELKCDNDGCTRSIKRCEMAFHIMECPKQVVQCPYSHMGCEFKSVREDLPTHIEKTMASHIEMVSKHVQVQSQVHHHVAPLVLKYTDFKLNKDIYKKDWASDSFYTGKGGYKMRLLIDPIYSSGKGKSTYISVYINLMPGANDDILQFPLRGEVSVTLLNQLEDRDHHEWSMSFNKQTDEVYGRKQVVDNTGWGCDEFVSHASLNQNARKKVQFLSNDTLYFRVSFKITSKIKRWLALT